jgi:putative transposase
MEHVAIKFPDYQENNIDKNIVEATDKTIPSGEEFFDMLEQQLRDIARITIINTINDEFETFIGAAAYQRSDDRTDCRNGFRYRTFETRFGVIKDITIPRSRSRRFIPKLFTRWKRRENKITRAIADMFVNGISTRKVKKITKAIWGRNYSATTVSRCNQVLKEDYLKWMNRPISQSIRYLFLDAVNLKIRRHWISKEALLCAIGITEDGKKEFLGFMLGGRESTASWESLLLLLLQRGLSVDHLKMVTVDGNAGLLSALASLLPGVTIQRCIVHKIRNIVGKCPRSLRGVVPAEAKLIFYATSQAEARERFHEFKARWQQQLPQIVECIEKDLDQLIAFYQFPYRHWAKIRSTNVIERAFKEFRRRVKVMETFPNEQSCLRIMLALSKMLNENWEYKPIKDF